MSDGEHEFPLSSLLVEVDLQDLVPGEGYLVHGVADAGSAAGRT